MPGKLEKKSELLADYIFGDHAYEDVERTAYSMLSQTRKDAIEEVYAIIASYRKRFRDKQKHNLKQEIDQMLLEIHGEVERNAESIRDK